MIFIVVTIFLFYFVLVIVLITGWTKAVNLKSGTYNAVHKPEILISVIVAARNEAHNIEALMADLARQNYSSFEVIFVDDHSEDSTAQVIKDRLINDQRFKLLSNKGHGKKAALTSGIEHATGEIIVTTDADCSVKAGWLKSIGDKFNDQSLYLLFGGVKMSEDNSLFSSLQAIEFCSLIGTAAATNALTVPTLCNGANLAFRKSVFIDVNGYADNFHIPSGDDEFLMRKINAKYPKGIHFNNDQEAIVETQPQQTLNDFIQQRLRWAGKWRYNKTAKDMLLAIFIISFQLSVLLLPILVFAGLISVVMASGLWLTKAALEYLFLSRIARHLQVKWEWRAFILLLILYPFYTVLIGILSNFKSFNWKGRNLKSINQNRSGLVDND